MIYNIGKIGLKSDGKHSVDEDNVFLHNGKLFELIFPITSSAYVGSTKDFIKGISKCSQLYLDEDETNTLCVYFDPNLPYNYHYMKYAIISQFFEIDLDHEHIRKWLPRPRSQFFVPASNSSELDTAETLNQPSASAAEGDESLNLERNEETTVQSSESTTTVDGQESNLIAKLYGLLRESHESTDKIDFTIPATISGDKLKPTLRRYQNDAVRWMYNREIRQSYYPSDYMPIKCFALSDTEFYFNARICDLTDRFNGDIPIPSGGILADEMGLGKTVEMLALILTNIRKKRSLSVDGNEPVAVPVAPFNGNLKCLCTSDVPTELIQCTKCFWFQHRKCVSKYSPDQFVQTQYICPDCWRYEAPVQSKATFIVSPKSIKMQWQSEIAKHVNDPSFKVLIYDGLKDQGWISPADLSDYDIVLTDYNVLTKEIWYPNNSLRRDGLRSRSRAIQPMSPLLLIDWWRVCLDEAQMVENALNKCSEMVKMLKATHRWAVTGTPIEKTVENLYGLLVFLDCAPYNDEPKWHTLTAKFHGGDSMPLVKMLTEIMWRTCKSLVWQELGIPSQTEIVHNVTMSDIQSFFYNSQHTQCAVEFREKATKLAKRCRTKQAMSMAKMSAQTLKLIMEPLRKLRQDCTAPMIFTKTAKQTKKKKVLAPDELLKHLQNNNESDCKTELRTIVSSMNGMAALYIIRGELVDAEKMYRQVLRWAKDYTGAISVDSLLQIHAIHNLFETMEMQGQSNYADKEQHQNEYERLEWKYLENSSQLIKEAKGKQLKIYESIEEQMANLNDQTLKWWTFIYGVYKCDNGLQKEQSLINKINDELSENYKNSALNRLSSVREIGYIIVNWLKKIDDERKSLEKWFEKVLFFADNLKRRQQLDVNILNKIETLIRSAFECHLNRLPDETTTKKNNKSKRKTVIKTTCLLCQIKVELNRYECIVFDKNYIEDDDKENIGTWNPSFEETMIKIVYAFGKREIDRNLRHMIEDGEIHLGIIEGLKNEFKEYSKYWVEVNYAVAAYDELHMCKSRLQCVSPEELELVPAVKAKQFISVFQVDYYMDEYQTQLDQAQLKFVRLQGTQKYLQHLKKSEKVEPCPICKQYPENKYAVLQCGHHMCMVCFLQMSKFYQTFVRCSVCRHEQSFENVYYVNRELESIDHNDGIRFVGDYSKKIEKIVKTILHLRQQERAVKIIIFSHWKTVINVIGDALRENGVAFRQTSAHFSKTIDEFKVNDKITCLLLPLASGSKGLNLIEATHVMLVEPILNPGEELQAIGRIHRIGQTRPTFVHRFIVMKTIEETIWSTISNDKTGKWKTKDVTVENLAALFTSNWNAIDDFASLEDET